MKSPFAAIGALLILAFANTTLFAKSATIGVYALVDQVTFEPDESSPKMIRIYGVFVVPEPMSSGSYRSPQRGYLYFQIRPGTEEGIRSEWKQLKALAGSGQVIGFADYWVSVPPSPNNPLSNVHRSLEVNVHTGKENATRDVYPALNPKGIIKHADEGDPHFDVIAEQLQKASRRQTPTANNTHAEFQEATRFKQ